MIEKNFAKKGYVILALEDTISAKDNVAIMERSQSQAVKVFYDVGNSTNNGFDIYQEIPWLGRDRISQFHLKDNPHYLGEGKIDFRRVFKLISDLDYRGFADLETSAPSKSVPDDMRRNLAYVRRLIGGMRAG
jgi:sugar phosphate isomerase/epimerase